jgi:N-acetylglucosaminyl-diphospho-decaprenol L-rhamnosyltransferase
MPPHLAVQIVNFNTKAHVEGALRSLARDATGGRFSTTFNVVDNASGDDLKGLQDTVQADVAVLQSPRNDGFGAGHNILARTTDADILCIVNPDVELAEPRVLERLLRHFEDPAVAVVGPRLVTPDGRVQRWDHGELRGLRARVANGAGHAHWRERTGPADVAWVSGAFLLVRRSAFEAVGGFDERFFLYKEEEDLCLRIRALGQRVVYDPTVAVQHVGSVVADRQTQMAASVAYYAQKHLRPRRRRALDLLYRHVTRRI